MNGEDRQTEAYEKLLDLVHQVSTVVTHSTFSTVFRTPSLVDMARDGHAVLQQFVRDPDVVAYDRSVAALLARREPALRVGPNPSEWLDGLGAIETRAALQAFVEQVYLGSKLDAQHVRTLRNGMKRMMTEVIAHAKSSPEFGQKVALAARQVQSALLESQHSEVDALLEEAAAGVASISRNEEIAEKTLGKIGDLQLAKYYSEFAINEGKSADGFRRLTVWMVLAATGTTMAFVLVPSAGLGWLDIAAGDWVRLVQRGVFVGAVFALGGYFARQAHQHRALANWAGSLAVQLRTFDAYLAAIENSDVRDDLRRAFGARVFGDHPAMKGEPTVTPSAAAMDTAVGWAAKLTAGGK